MVVVESFKKRQETFLFALLKGLFAVGSVLKRIVVLRPILYRLFDFVCGEKLLPEMYWDSLFGCAMLENVWCSILVDANKRVSLGGKAYDSPVLSESGRRCHRLLDFARTGRPLVVNFGSSTCPIFMKKLQDYRTMVERYQDVADFVIVYIEEAHPCDGWAFQNNNNIPSHCTQTDRCSAAQLLSTHDAPCPVLVDTMLDAANIAYGAMPIRLYVIQDSHVVYQGGAGPMGYKMDDVSAWLIKNA